MSDFTANTVTNYCHEHNRVNTDAYTIKMSDVENLLTNWTIQSTSVPCYFAKNAYNHLDGILGKFEGTKIPNGAKTIIRTIKNDGIRFIFRDGDLIIESARVIPNITDVQVIQDKVVIVLFADGTKEKAVLDSADTFSIEQGVSICITKKLLSAKTNGNGSSAYNKIIAHCLKVYNDNRKAEEQAKIDVQTAKDKEKRAVEKAKKKRKKKADKQREREIEIQKEAYLRAMREFGGKSAVND